jgi:hypothetical protein
MIVVFAFVLFTAAVAWLFFKNEGLGIPGIYLFGLYAVSLLCSCIVIGVQDWATTFGPTAFFLAVILLFVSPLASTKPVTRANCPAPEWHPFLTGYSWIMALVACVGTLTTIRSVFRLLMSGQLADVRNAMYQGNGNAGTEMTLTALLASGLWPVCLCLFFFALLTRRPLPLVAALGAGSVSGVFVMLALAGRSGMVYFGLLSGFLIALCWPLIVRYRPNLRFQIRVAGVVGLAGLALMTFYIALARGIGGSGTFSVVSNNSTLNSLYSLVLYGGSSILNFQDFWIIYDDFDLNLMGKRSFPVFCGVLRRLGFIDDFSAVDMLTIYKPFYDAYNLEHAVFCGFQRELMMDFGRLGTLAGSAVWALLGWLVRRRYEQRLDFFSIMAMAFFGSVPLLGIFFLSYGENQGNISLVAMVGTIGFLRLVQKVPAKSPAARQSPAQVPPVLRADRVANGDRGPLRGTAA